MTPDAIKTSARVVGSITDIARKDLTRSVVGEAVIVYFIDMAIAEAWSGKGLIDPPGRPTLFKPRLTMSQLYVNSTLRVS